MSYVTAYYPSQPQQQQQPVEARLPLAAQPGASFSHLDSLLKSNNTTDTLLYHVGELAKGIKRLWQEAEDLRAGAVAKDQERDGVQVKVLEALVLPSKRPESGNDHESGKQSALKGCSKGRLKLALAAVVIGGVAWWIIKLPTPTLNVRILSSNREPIFCRKAYY